MYSNLDNMDYDNERLKKWFKSLSPAKRLEIAEELERFRRRARFVEA
jgi:hypothetical protein